MKRPVRSIKSCWASLVVDGIGTNDLFFLCLLFAKKKITIYSAIIGDLDPELDEATDFENLRVEPLDPVRL